MTFLRRLEMHEVELSMSSMEDADFPDGHTVTVRARWNGFQGSASGGPHWFDTEEEFQSAGTKYDLCARALENLQEFLDRMAGRLEPLLTKESFDSWVVKKVQDE